MKATDYELSGDLVKEETQEGDCYIYTSFLLFYNKLPQILEDQDNTHLLVHSQESDSV